MRKVRISKEAAFIKKAAESGSLRILKPGRILTISTKEVPKFSSVKELDEALGLTELAGPTLADTRTGRNVQHEQVALLRQSVYSRLAGYEDTNDGRAVGSRSGHVRGSGQKKREASGIAVIFGF